MDLNEMAKNLSFTSNMDAHNVTSTVLSLIAQFGRKSKKLPESKLLIPNGIGMYRAPNEVVDETRVLAHNLTNILYSYFQNNTALLEVLTKNLNNEEIRWREAAERRVSDITFTIIVVIYIIVIAFGSFGNLVVISSFVRQPTLRTPRNSFILNLAVSDLLLCIVTTPLTLLDIINEHWPLGNSALSCKVAGGLQAVSVFVSTISITVIALDRYQLIVYPTRDVLKRIGSAVVLLFIWFLGFLLALPIFMVLTLEHHEMDSTKGAKKRGGEQPYERGNHSIDYCYEKWPIANGRAIYSVFTLVIQYALPILIISVLHTKICQKLQTRHTVLESMAVSNTRNRIKAAKRLRRRHNLLMAIALIFSITWLPLNVLNLVLDIHNPFKLPRDEEKMIITYAISHLFGMSSACINPFLYGWFNDSFRNEFIGTLSAPLRLCFLSKLCHNLEVSRLLFSVTNNRSLSVSPDADDEPTRQHQRVELHHPSRINTVVEGNNADSVCWVDSSSSSKLGNNVTADKDWKKTTTLSPEKVIEGVVMLNSSCISLHDDGVKVTGAAEDFSSSAKLKETLSWSPKKLMETHL